MPFSFHPPTGRPCPVCEELAVHDRTNPIVDTHNGKASSANNFPIHNWYSFVLGYSPQFPEYVLQREQTTEDALVMDPFMGTGTTLIACKLKGIASQGIDANDFIVDAARTKLNWELDISQLRDYRNRIIEETEHQFQRYRWYESVEIYQPALFALYPQQNIPNAEEYAGYVRERRPEMLLEKYISDRPLARAFIIDETIKRLVLDRNYRDFFDLALTSTIIPISNVRYGPGFGMIKPKDDAPVLEVFIDKLNRMIQDLEIISTHQRTTFSQVALGDSRFLTSYFEPNTVSLMITSPPYPGDHEYTKHTRLEILFRQYAATHEEFRLIKQRMIRASTTNIYKDDNDRKHVQDIDSIQQITNLIQERLNEDGATSGFEKLYTKLIWEYFGGMYKSLEQCLQILRPGGKIALLVSDSHAFKMVHVQTASILGEIALQVGFESAQTILWQLKPSTSHNYALRENILVLTKPR